MADIISIKAHPRSHERSAPRTDGGSASIILFPGVRYERADAKPDGGDGSPSSTKRKTAGGEPRKSRA